MSGDCQAVRNPSEKGEFFNDIARRQGGFAITAEDSLRLEQLRVRLGGLLGRCVIEPGCGSGPLTAWLARWVGPSGQVHAFDPSPDMITIAREAVADFPQVRLSCARVEEVPLAAGLADCVICFRALPHFDDPALALARIAEWLRPGGRLHIVHWLGRSQLGALHCDHRPVANDAFPPGRKLARWLAASGLGPTDWIEDDHEIYVAARRMQ